MPWSRAERDTDDMEGKGRELPQKEQSESGRYRIFTLVDTRKVQMAKRLGDPDAVVGSRASERKVKPDIGTEIAPSWMGVLRVKCQVTGGNYPYQCCIHFRCRVISSWSVSPGDGNKLKITQLSSE